MRDYLVPRPDGGVICGGAKHTFFDAKELWYNNFDDSTLIPVAATRSHFETVMQDNFRGWEKSGASVDMLWTGSEIPYYSLSSRVFFLPSPTSL